MQCKQLPFLLEKALLCLIVFLFILLTAENLLRGLPLFPHVDASNLFSVFSLYEKGEFLASFGGERNPVNFGVVYYEVVALVYAPFHFYGVITGNTPSFDEVAYHIVITARIVSWVASIATLFLCYQMGKVLAGVPAGLLAAVCYALSPMVFNTYYMEKQDALATFLVTLTVFLCFKRAEEKKQIFTVFAAISGGIAVVTKYHTAGIALPLLLLTPFLCGGRSGLKVFGESLLAFILFFFTAAFLLAPFYHAIIEENGAEVMTRGPSVFLLTIMAPTVHSVSRGFLQLSDLSTALFGSVWIGCAILSGIIAGLFLSRHSSLLRVATIFPLAFIPLVFFGAYTSNILGIPELFLITIPFLLVTAVTGVFLPFRLIAERFPRFAEKSVQKGFSIFLAAGFAFLVIGDAFPHIRKDIARLKEQNTKREEITRLSYDTLPSGSKIATFMHAAPFGLYMPFRQNTYTSKQYCVINADYLDADDYETQLRLEGVQFLNLYQRDLITHADWHIFDNHNITGVVLHNSTGGWGHYIYNLRYSSYEVENRYPEDIAEGILPLSILLKGKSLAFSIAPPYSLQEGYVVVWARGSYAVSGTGTLPLEVLGEGSSSFLGHFDIQVSKTFQPYLFPYKNINNFIAFRLHAPAPEKGDILVDRISFVQRKETVQGYHERAFVLSGNNGDGSQNELLSVEDPGMTGESTDILQLLTDGDKTTGIEWVNNKGEARTLLITLKKEYLLKTIFFNIGETRITPSFRMSLEVAGSAGKFRKLGTKEYPLPRLKFRKGERTNLSPSLFFSGINKRVQKIRIRFYPAKGSDSFRLKEIYLTGEP